MQNNLSVQAQNAQSGFSPEMSMGKELNEGNDHDGDDAIKNSANNAQALNQLLNKQKNAVFPTNNQNQGLQKVLSNKQDLQSLLMKSIESLYSTPSKTYANTSLNTLMGGINVRA
jgi:hypothetical protein